METTISNAMYLLMIGMATVFVILACVALTGRILILMVNSWSPEKVEEKSDATLELHTAIAKKAISTLTNGKGEVKRITKIQ